MLLKTFYKYVYGRIIGTHAWLNYAPKNTQKIAKVFYGGAMGGVSGGPQVKVDLLKQAFPQNFNEFNLVYILSGALYVPEKTLKFLKSKEVPIVLNQNGVYYPAWHPKNWHHENERMAKAMELSSHVFYQSEFCKKSADKFLGVTAKSYDILYNGVDTQKFCPIDKEKNKVFQFLITGNINNTTYYRLTTALDVLAKAKKQGLDIEIYFYGLLPNDLKEKFISLIKIKNLQNSFFVMNGYSRADAPKIYAQADAYIMTKHNDPCPNVVLEAMSSGLPILHVSSGGVPELVGSDCGFCVDVAESYDKNSLPNIDDMISGIDFIIQSHNDLSRNARARAVEKFDIKNWVDVHRSKFNDLLGMGGVMR